MQYVLNERYTEVDPKWIFIVFTLGKQMPALIDILTHGRIYYPCRIKFRFSFMNHYCSSPQPALKHILLTSFDI